MKQRAINCKCGVLGYIWLKNKTDGIKRYYIWYWHSFSCGWSGNYKKWDTNKVLLSFQSNIQDAPYGTGSCGSSVKHFVVLVLIMQSFPSRRYWPVLYAIFQPITWHQIFYNSYTDRGCPVESNLPESKVTHFCHPGWQNQLWNVWNRKENPTLSITITVEFP